MGSKPRPEKRKGVAGQATTTIDLAGEAIKQTIKGARRIAHAASEVPELIQLQRSDRALRSEMDDHLRSIGKRVFFLHKRARGESPFARYPVIMEELDVLRGVTEEYRTNRVRLKQVREEMTGKH
jgi:hypothetical protein